MRRRLTYKDQVYELETMSKEDLLALKSRIDGSCGEVKQTLADARRKFILDGIPADPGWYKRTTIAQRIYGQNSQAIQAEIAQRNVVLREANREATERMQALNQRVLRVRLAGTVAEIDGETCRLRVGEQELSVPITVEQSESIVVGMAVHVVACIVPPEVEAEQRALSEQLFPERFAKQWDAEDDLSQSA